MNYIYILINKEKIKKKEIIIINNKHTHNELYLLNFNYFRKTKGRNQGEFIKGGVFSPAQGELKKVIAIVQQLNSHCFLTKTTCIFC